jgi:phage N-6-adenine-methyltransferase
MNNAINNKTAGARGSGSDTWLTPDWIIDGVHLILGGMDLDPCGHSSKNTRANDTIVWPERDGLREEWGPLVYCNPPFSNIELWVEKAARERDKRFVSTIMLAKFDARLTGSRNRTSWHQHLMDESAACRILCRYVRFSDEHGNKQKPATFQTALYLISNNPNLLLKFTDYNPLPGYNVQTPRGQKHATHN